MRIQMPEQVEYIITQLAAAGYEAYAVGGCVRDSLLGRIPEDWDITTSASPKEVKAVFRRTIDTGIQHGTVTVMLEKEGFEVTTYRIDGKYEDSRHPESVTFTRSLIEDLKRRDFTVNAMAYNHESGIVDAFEGMKDLKECRIRCVGNPAERFSEDALRMLRAVRFSAQLGFTIEEETKQAIARLSSLLQHISRERIQAELTKLLTAKYPEEMRAVFETGLSKLALPGMEGFWENGRLESEIHMLKALPQEPILRWTALLHRFSRKDDGRALLKGLKFDNHTIEYVTRLVHWIPYGLSTEKPGLRKEIYEIGEDIMPLLFPVQTAYSLASLPAEESGHAVKRIAETKKLYEEIIQAGDCLSLKNLAVDGKDLIALGIKPGKEVGQLLNDVLYRVLENPDLNKKDTLLSYLHVKNKK